MTSNIIDKIWKAVMTLFVITLLGFILYFAYIASLIMGSDFVLQHIASGPNTQEYATIINESGKDLKVFSLGAGFSSEYNIYWDRWSTLREVDPNEVDYLYREKGLKFFLLKIKGKNEYKLLEIEPEHWNKAGYFSCSKLPTVGNTYTIPDWEKVKKVSKELSFLKEGSDKLSIHKLNSRQLEALENLN
ncbi:MAG: hypothetical protein ABEJ24_05395 [Candidatus Magasanikbacteria bacterium]